MLLGHTGPYRAIQGYKGPYGQLGPNRAIQGNMVPYGAYRTILGTKMGHTEPYWYTTGYIWWYNT